MEMTLTYFGLFQLFCKVLKFFWRLPVLTFPESLCDENESDRMDTLKQEERGKFQIYNSNFCGWHFENKLKVNS